MHPMDWDSRSSPTGWWMSEKFDGIRAYWDSARKKFFSRNGNELQVPDWFKENMPNIPLDGELWYI